MSIPVLRQALLSGALRHLDVYFAERLTENVEQGRGNVALAAALVSNSVGGGHVCLDLKRAAGKLMLASESFSGIQTPGLSLWLQQIKASGIAGASGEIKPLILHGEHLYLGRYWHFEQELAARLTEMAKSPAIASDKELLRQGLDRLFAPSDETDWQKLAAAMALTQLLTIISGGPGTGKTHTVTAILALLTEQALASGSALRIGLAAPTGKAAARLTESIRNARSSLDVSPEVRTAIADEAQTLHRLLGVRPDRVTPRYNASNPLHLDVLVLDEASMIDLPLMNRVLAALPETARLIVLGDKDQLSSVEAGSVFADLCGSAGQPEYSSDFLSGLQHIYDCKLPAQDEEEGALSDNRVMLQKSYRFDQSSGIGRLAKAVNAGDAKMAQSLLSAEHADVTWRVASGHSLTKALAEYAVQAFAPVMQAASPEMALDTLETFRMLCAVRRGPTGVEQVNQLVRQALAEAGHIHVAGEFYKGRPIMVVRNDYHLGLFNGDIGILWPDREANNELRAWFRKPDNSIHSLLPARLPAHETAFALTVHKSQGSEFDSVLLLLPEQESPVLTRELVYTGITRAAKNVELWGSASMLEYAIKHTVERNSGLSDKLNQAR